MHSRGLHAGTSGDDLVSIRNDNRGAGEVGKTLAIRLRTGPTADKVQLASGVGPGRGERVSSVKQAAKNTVERRQRQFLACCGRADVGQEPGGVGEIRCAFTIEVRHHDGPVRSWR